MTVIVGILCSDGVVIGSDSAMGVGRSTTGYTIERQDGDVLKIEVIENNIITAFTGAVGLSQRFNDQLRSTIRSLRQEYQAPQVNAFGQIIGTPLQQILVGKVQYGSIPFDSITPVEMGRIISQTTVMDFQRTAFLQTTNGWGFGALVAFVSNDKPELIDFDPVQFHPELKGQPDASRGDHDRNWRCVSWGAGAKLADAFLAHAYRVLFVGKPPTVSRAKLVVAWTVDHVMKYNPGLVGGKQQLAVLEKLNGTWEARHMDPGETIQQVDALEKYIYEFGEKQKQDAAAQATGVDLNKELAVGPASGGPAANSPSIAAKPDEQA